MVKSNKLGDSALKALPKLILNMSLHQFFKLLYHQLAWMYDWVSYIASTGNWNKWLDAVLPYLDGPKTLEIGFGPGHLQADLCSKGISTYGIDESRQMVHIARKRLTRLEMHPGLIRGNAQHLPFADLCINQVVMTFPSEYMINPATLTEIRRVLIKQGKVIILPLAWVTGRKAWEQAIAWFSHLIGETPDWDENILEPFKNAGFDVSWKLINFPTSKIMIIFMLKC